MQKLKKVTALSPMSKTCPTCLKIQSRFDRLVQLWLQTESQFEITSFVWTLIIKHLQIIPLWFLTFRISKPDTAIHTGFLFFVFFFKFPILQQRKSSGMTDKFLAKRYICQLVVPSGNVIWAPGLYKHSAVWFLFLCKRAKRICNIYQTKPLMLSEEG